MKCVLGMKYRIKQFDKIPHHWNSKGHMDKWMGQIVEIDKIYKSGPPRIMKIIDDKRRWNWRESDFEYVDGLDEFGLSEEDFIL